MVAKKQKSEDLCGWPHPAYARERAFVDSDQQRESATVKKSDVSENQKADPLSVPGVYEIVNSKNGKKYVGQSENISKRWKEHKKELNCGKHHSCTLQEDWNIYRQESFSCRLISIEHDKDKREELEDEIINKERLLTCGYNRVNREIRTQIHESETKINKLNSDPVKYDAIAQQEWEESYNELMPELEKRQSALYSEPVITKSVLVGGGLVGAACMFLGPFGLLAAIPAWKMAKSSLDEHSRKTKDIKSKIYDLQIREPKKAAQRERECLLYAEERKIKEVVRKNYKN